jgi:sodium/potassium-transporting ATPase subunit alpha
MEFHKVGLEKLYASVSSSEHGLSTAEAERRLKQHGYNTLGSKKKSYAIVKFFLQFKNFFALLLVFGALLAFLAEYLMPGEGNLYIGIALAVVVLLNAVFTFIQEYQSEKIMDSFKNMLPERIEVLRDMKRQTVESKYIVPGDVIFLSEGDKISADARLIEEHTLKVDNASITGESEPQLRKLEFTHDNILESRNMVFSGTLVQSGNGRALVYGTGMNTQIGQIAALTKQTQSTQTPLRKELNRFIKIISTIAIVLGALFFGISFFLGNPLMGSLIFAIGIIVANVPEGLLPTVTLCLTIASKKMAKKNALIKNLESVETLGSTTVICTDKTGTITQNKISVNSLFVGMKEGVDSNLLLRTMVLCNNARSSKGKFVGDPTETALLDYANGKVDVNKFPRLDEEPFDSKTKRMITINKIGNKKVAYMKGAPERVLELCNEVMVGSDVKKLTASYKKKVDAHYKKLASNGERVLGFAYKEKKEFVFIGLVGMIDPPRKEIPKAVAKCQSAGIKIIMITGDHSLTAESIAKQVGIVRGTANILTGEELSKLNEDGLRRFLKKENLIFSRTSPVQKLRIVEALQSLGEIVTVTGDGVNDAPALKNANMGVAMASGTDVAREASDMVLMDDNFATIVNAVEEGRTIFENIKRFIVYILTSNVPQILPFIAFVLLGLPLPLTVVLILAIDLGTDLLPAIGLGMEKAEMDVMKRSPRKEKLLTKKMLFFSYGVVGVIQAAAGFFAYFYVLFTNGWVWGQELAWNNPLYLQAVTAFFISIVICQIADVLARRTRRQSVFKAGFFKNGIVWLGILVEILLVACIMYIPALNTLFGTAPLFGIELVLAVPFALVIFFGDELRKWLIRSGKEVLSW